MVYMELEEVENNETRNNKMHADGGLLPGDHRFQNDQGTQRCKGTPIGYPCPFAKKMKELVEKETGDTVRLLDHTH